MALATHTQTFAHAQRFSDRPLSFTGAAEQAEHALELLDVCLARHQMLRNQEMGRVTECAYVCVQIDHKCVVLGTRKLIVRNIRRASAIRRICNPLPCSTRSTSVNNATAGSAMVALVACLSRKYHMSTAVEYVLAPSNSSGARYHSVTTWARPKQTKGKYFWPAQHSILWSLTSLLRTPRTRHLPPSLTSGVIGLTGRW